MSFTRLDYDDCAYAKDLEESTDPLCYWTFLGKYEQCKKCPQGDFTNNLEFGVRADVESELRNQTRLYSKCPSKKYNPKKPYKSPKFTPARVCESIHGITPNNLDKPVTTGVNESKLGRNCCKNN
jgi:hypothetical protein